MTFSRHFTIDNFLRLALVAGCVGLAAGSISLRSLAAPAEHGPQQAGAKEKNVPGASGSKLSEEKSNAAQAGQSQNSGLSEPWPRQLDASAGEEPKDDQGDTPVSNATENSAENSDENAAESKAQNSDENPSESTADLAKIVVDETILEQEAAQHYYLSSTYLRSWELELAEIELEEATIYAPDMKAAHRDLCIVSLLRLNPLRSVAEFMMVTGLGEPIPYTDAEKAELNKRALIAHYKKGLAWGRKRDWKQAATELEWALTYGPGDFAIHRSLAFAYANLGDFTKAEKQYADTFALAPSDGFAHADFANLLAEKGQVDRAESELQKAVQLSPSAAALHVDLGWVAEAKGDLATASQEFTAAVGLSPSHAGLWAHLGRILEREGEKSKALDAYARALNLDPQLPEARESLTRLKQKSS